MSKQYAMTSKLAVKSPNFALRTLPIVVLLASCANVFGQLTSHVRVTPSFPWPQSQDGLASANRTPRPQLQAFLQAVWKATAGGSGPVESLRINEVRFAQLGREEICMAVTFGSRFPWGLDIVCPERGEFVVTGLTDERMGLLAADLIDLDGDGFAEVISSRFAAGYQGASTPPLYWYTIYSFKDGLPHDVSQEFPDFYRVEVDHWADKLERIIMPPVGSDSKESRNIEARIVFTRLKYQRNIHGDRKAGLQEAAGWAESSDPSLQELALMTVREINDPAAVEIVKKLTSSKYQGVCREAVGTLAGIEHREVTGQELESKCKAQ
jgi:hypothetical protein